MATLVIRAVTPLCEEGGRNGSGFSGLLSLGDRSRHAGCVHHRGRVDVERIGKPDEQIEKRTDVHSLGDLRITPPGVPQRLHLFVGDPVGVSRQRADKFQEQTLCGRDRRAVQVAVSQRLGDLAELLSLQLQEPRVAAQSIVAVVQRRDPRRNHLVLRTCERAVGKVQT